MPSNAKKLDSASSGGPSRALRSHALDDRCHPLAHADAHGRAARSVRPSPPAARAAERTSRAPLIPSGWPSAIAPPLGLTRGSLSLSPSSRRHAIACAANASLSSITSICDSVSPVRVEHRSRSRHRAHTHDARLHARRRRSPATARVGSSENSLTARSDATSSAAAPSLIPEEFPAVTDPPARNAGLSRASASSVVSARMNSSCSNRRTSPRFSPGTSTAVISLAKRPRPRAAAARACVRHAKRS